MPLKEFAERTLDRLLGKSILDGLVHESGMSEDGEAGSSNEPENRGEWRSDEAQRNRNAEKGGVQLGRGSLDGTDFEIGATQPANSPHSSDDEENDKQQQEVGQQRVDAQHYKDHGIVAGEVGEIVGCAALDFTEVLGLRNALEIEELAEGADVREAVRQRHAIGALRKAVQTESL